MPKPLPERDDDADPAAMPIPQTDHHAGAGAGAAPRRTAESTSTRGPLPREPLAGAAPRHGSAAGTGDSESGLVGGLTTLQVVAAVSLGAVLAAGVAAAVVAVLGDDEEDDEPAAAPRPAGKKSAAAGRPKKRPAKRSTGPRAAADPAASGGGAAGRVDLNEADERELAALPGLGPATATAILARRPFASVDELQEVSGIGPALFKKLKPRVSV
ncbi:ComEA family DNA-binding protein [Phycisphaera mikurensis]|uniref:Putative DNA-binding protein n=1 Tax=Phycisphaera mikurensis (strain NBRC 102666 / KCTC 22515 / FYK2301M01) TaxID=1142394 RepID=I0IIE7_PHYMF|nr:helix-hairpin-helix domain-containing protein [Phycisphaera mikurensis]MBB6442401.1 competence protein ComEA [Phycisphaera mikurensis]BAM05035.1 putative DNA-binding protein [Phycisphaera mikurensis NBRC 102666]